VRKIFLNFLFSYKLMPTMAELAPRITGTEMEWGLVLSERGNIYNNPALRYLDILDDHLPPELAKVKSGPGNGYYTANGSRIYVDVGDHIEYATPEDTSFWGTVANEIASETILTTMLDGYTASSKSQPDSYELHKRVAGDDKDGNAETWGYHENYFMPDAEDLPDPSKLALVGIHLATRQVFTGAGMCSQDGTFFISQKMPAITQGYNRGTTNNNKPLVNLRNEAHRGEQKIGMRLHVTSGDPNMSPYITFLKLGTTSIVTRLVEHNADTRYPLSGNTAVEAAVRFAGDTALTKVVTLDDGSRIRALDAQEYLIELARKNFDGRRDVVLPPEEQVALAWWQNIIDDLRRDPMSVTEVEWVTKKRMLERQREKRKLNNDEARLLDRRWDVIDDNGVGIALRKSRWAQWYDEALVESRTWNAPSTTRAHTRAHFTRLAHEHARGSESISASWDTLSRGARVKKIGNPYYNSLDKAEELFTARSVA
jgi:proteasome accessory factor A